MRVRFNYFWETESELVPHLECNIGRKLTERERNLEIVFKVDCYFNRAERETLTYPGHPAYAEDFICTLDGIDVTELMQEKCKDDWQELAAENHED